MSKHIASPRSDKVMLATVVISSITLLGGLIFSFEPALPLHWASALGMGRMSTSTGHFM